MRMHQAHAAFRITSDTKMAVMLMHSAWEVCDLVMQSTPCVTMALPPASEILRSISDGAISSPSLMGSWPPLTNSRPYVACLHMT